MTGTMTSQNIDLSSRDTLYIKVNRWRLVKFHSIDDWSSEVYRAIFHFRDNFGVQ